MPSLRLILFLLLFITLQSCAHIEPMHSGIIRDAESQKPLSSAIVNLHLDYTCYFPPPLAGPNSETLGDIEVKTDDNGKFVLPWKVYFLPPLLCLTDKYFTYAKAGYFKILGKSNSGDINLLRMDHYINYLPYKSEHSFLSSAFEERSALFKTELAKLKGIVLEPLDDKGVFLRLPGKNITQIYSRSTRPTGSYLKDIIYYAYDAISKEWITFDSRGKMTEFKSSVSHWDFMSTDISWGWPIYANRDSIYYPIDENFVPADLKYKKGDIQYITAKTGNISGLFGNSNDFFTIEDNGNAFCHYGITTNQSLIAHFLDCFSGNDLPASVEDDSIKSSVFKFAIQTLNHGMFIVTRSQRAWHIYKFGRSYDAETNRAKLAFEEIDSFPIEKEITAFTATGNEFFVAFKNDGLKKYRIITGYGLDIEEDAEFALNAQMTKNLNISSLIYGRAVNVPALYVTTGEDKIYRFSEDGIPDYIIKQ